MTKLAIIGFLTMAIAVPALLFYTIWESSEYATFELAYKQQPETVTVVGTLDLSEPITFDSKTSLLEFTAIDKDGERSKVLYNQPKPTDFERSEEITMTGHASDSLFIATEILMKCPSKYANSEGPVSTASL
jgi:cytochrome c-type biogenesis protein CcmE